MQIIFPFYWQCSYIPLCPIWMSNYLAAPGAPVIGLDSRFFDLYDKPDEVNAIDLDANTITLGKKHALKKYEQFIRNTSCFSTMCDFSQFWSHLCGTMHCLPQRLKSMFFEIFSSLRWPLRGRFI